MRDSIHQLVTEWRKLSVDRIPYVLSGDETVLERGFYNSWEEFINSPDLGTVSPSKLHLGLFPVPYIGSLERASVFILMLNPGFSPGDYYVEQNAKFRAAQIRTIQQTNARDDHPFTGLDPRFAWHPGFNYWEGRFRNLARELVNQGVASNYQAALEHLAQRVACLELMPYHSRSFGSAALLRHLHSTKLIRHYVHEVVVPKAEAGLAVLVVTRSARYWDLPLRENIVVYKGSETRGAYLTLKTRGGKAIAQHFGLRIPD